MRKTIIFSIIVGMSLSAYGQDTARLVPPLSEIYAKSGIKVGVPARFSIIEGSDCIWISDDGTTPVDRNNGNPVRTLPQLQRHGQSPGMAPVVTGSADKGRTVSLHLMTKAGQ